MRKVSSQIQLKSGEDIAGIYRSAQISAGMLDAIEEEIEPGVTTGDLDEFAEDYIRSRGGDPVFKDYRGFPASICTSVNEEIIHAIPSDDKVLEAGDLITVDVGTELEGYISDTARTFSVGDGQPDPEVERLLEGTKRALQKGIAQMQPGKKLGAVSAAIEKELKDSRLTIVRELTGHGIGYELHEPAPTVYNFGKPDQGPVMEEGLVVAIEPMTSLGSSDIVPSSDGWTYSIKDGALSAHFEHTVALWKGEGRVLTTRQPDYDPEIFRS